MYDPPPEPPPSLNPSDRPYLPSQPPPYHDWTSVLDTSFLPPPPSIGHERSSTSNSDAVSADRAHEWCRANKLILPHPPIPDQYAAINRGDVRLIKPVEYEGQLWMQDVGRWQCSTRAGNKDACLLSSAPLYFATEDSPLHTTRSKTIYFEVKIKSLGQGSRIGACSIAIGYCCLPYPTWRLPGWERGSLAIHSDDGRRYVNDTWGGKDFTAPFNEGDVIGLGMKYSLSQKPPEYTVLPDERVLPEIEVFLTRNGDKESGWDLFEQLDQDRDQSIDGLDGLFDLYAAIGSFGGVEFEVVFKSDEWLWQPHK